MLQYTSIQFEQFIQSELEQNPMLEDAGNPDDAFDFEEESEQVVSPKTEEYDEYDENYSENSITPDPYYAHDDDRQVKSDFNEDNDPFDMYSMIWQDTSEMARSSNDAYSEDDEPGFQIKAVTSLEEDLAEQLNLIKLNEEEKILGIHIIGNIDSDGYLRRPLDEIIDEVNSYIAETNFNIQHKEYLKRQADKEKEEKNPAKNYSLSEESQKLLENANKLKGDDFAFDKIDKSFMNFNINQYELKILMPVNPETAEKVLAIIQSLDPPGIASRNVQECLLAQCKSFMDPTPAQLLATRIINEGYEPFIKKHYQVLIRRLGVSEQEIKDAIEVIKRLNPKPGGGDSPSELNTIIPDFVVHRDEDTDELIISMNDSRMPNLKLSKAYEHLQREAELNNYNKETKNWIRGKREDAKFLIQAIKQRKSTMIKVMTAITMRQKDFFYIGKNGLKPLIYKDIAEETGIDISTVCRIVNGKYVQTDFGTYELKFFFSESLIADDGQDVSTIIIKDKVKELINNEPKDKPYSDEIISKMLKEHGFNVARRTVAKYREQLKIPVARLRIEL